MANTNIQLTDINPGWSKTIAVNYFLEKNPYYLNGWTTELALYNVNGVATVFEPIIKESSYSTFYLSSEETTKLAALFSNSVNEIIHDVSKSLYYEINLVKNYDANKRQILKDEEVKVLLCSGNVLVEDMKNEK